MQGQTSRSVISLLSFRSSVSFIISSLYDNAKINRRAYGTYEPIPHLQQEARHGWPGFHLFISQFLLLNLNYCEVNTRNHKAGYVSTVVQVTKSSLFLIFSVCFLFSVLGSVCDFNPKQRIFFMEDTI